MSGMFSVFWGQQQLIVAAADRHTGKAQATPVLTSRLQVEPTLIPGVQTGRRPEQPPSASHSTS